MPTNQALQFFYGTIPLMLVLAAIHFRKNLLLRDILKRLGNIEDVINHEQRSTA